MRRYRNVACIGVPEGSSAKLVAAGLCRCGRVPMLNRKQCEVCTRSGRVSDGRRAGRLRWATKWMDSPMRLPNDSDGYYWCLLPGRPKSGVVIVFMSGGSATWLRDGHPENVFVEAMPKGTRWAGPIPYPQ